MTDVLGGTVALVGDTSTTALGHLQGEAAVLPAFFGVRRVLAARAARRGGGGPGGPPRGAPGGGADPG